MTVENVQGWLPAEYDYEAPKRGQIRKGIVLSVDKDGVMVDIGLKRDGFVPLWDLERLDEEMASQVQPGEEVVTRIVKPMRSEDSIHVSLYQALSEKDWDRSEEMLESGEIWTGEVTGHNRGGVTVSFGHLRAFVPASHLWDRIPRGISTEEREEKLRAQVGKELPLKIIEVNRDRNRLIMSERLARREMREAHMEELLDELREGDIRHGRVRALKPFGAFVDIGGADGLVHISEIAWRRIRHPREVLKVGDEVDVQILSVDEERNRIGLSLKRMQPNPWQLVDMLFFEGQIVKGRVTNVVDFGAFVALDAGIEGLVHISEFADPEPVHPSDMVKQGDELVLRVIRIESQRERMALSLKRVDEAEREQWLAEHEEEQAKPEPSSQPAEAMEAPAPAENETAPEPAQAEEATPVAEEAGEDGPTSPSDEGYWDFILARQQVNEEAEA